MKAIFRFSIVMLVIFGVAALWKTDRPKLPKILSKNSQQKNDPEENHQLLNQSFKSEADLGWSKEKFQIQLNEAFAANDPCAVRELLTQLNNAPASQFWSAGMAVLLARQRERNPLLEELLGNEDSPLYGRPAEGSRRIQTRFFNALAYADMLDAGDKRLVKRSSQFHNFEKAASELKDLMQEDPDNGAYAYYLAEVLRRSGAKKEEAQAAFLQAGKAARFNTFYQNTYDALLSSAYENAAAFAWVYNFIPNAAFPESTTRNLKAWAKESETGRWIAQKISKKFIDLGVEYKNRSPGYLYSRAEYISGQNLRYTINGLVDRDRDDFFKKMKEAQDFISQQPPSVTEAEANIYRSLISNDPHDCAPDSWKTLFESFRQKAGHS